MEKLYQITHGLMKRFPNGNDPFQMVTRLAEECGELAAQVNHFEASGVKRQKLGEPDTIRLAKEVQDVLRCALTLAVHYGIEAELADSMEQSYQKLLAEGFID
ncbi:MAG: MazG nucleotide pyrophosphohydrolase domain-containing protein [Chloroflexota bacterium]